MWSRRAPAKVLPADGTPPKFDPHPCMKSPRVPLTGLLLRPASLVAELWRVSPRRRATFGLMFFCGVGGYLVLLFLRLDRGLLLSWAGVGVILGAGAAAMGSRRGPELGLVPLGGLVLIFALWILGRNPTSAAWLVAMGFAGGWFLVPLAGYLRDTAEDSRPGFVAAGWMSGLAMLLGAALFCFLAASAGLHLSAAAQFRVLAGLTLFMTLFALKHLPHQTLCTTMRLMGPIFYRVRVLGHKNVPAGGALVLCNHLSYVDAVVLQIAAPRPLRFIAFAGFVKSPAMRFIFRAAGVIPVNANKPSKGIRLAVEAIKNGELVCIFPEGAISRTGQLMQLKRGFGLISEMAGASIVPAVIDGLWGSVFSFAGNKYLWKSPRLMPTPVCVMFGPVIPPQDVNRGSVRRAMLDLGEAAFQERPVLKRNLAREVVRSLAKRPRHIEVVDRTAERREMTAAQLLAVAATLSRRLRKNIPEKRIGIVLPPGAGAHIANLAIACAGKTPVNLNFTVGRSAIEASLRIGEIKTILTADALRGKLPNFPFPKNTLDLRREIEAAGGKRAILPWLVAAWVLPNQWVATLLGLPRRGDNEEAALLFTSGSSGEPKGVVLTHRNILANCAQISSLSILPDTAVLLGCLPVFHSFGFTVTLWYPMLRGCRVVTLPSPLDTRKIAEAISQEKVTVMLGAPTFVRPLLKKATKEELKTLDLVVTGAEKLPMDLYDGFLATFGIEILQGYGLTETTPASNINQHHPPITTSTAEPQLGKKTGAVGRLMPGMTARIVDPDTGAELPMGETGMVWMRGANVFPGYLKDPEKTAAAFHDGWFITGDLGKFDEDGFLFIEGRLSRFSKIGGEMVPHGTIEQRIIAAFGWDEQDGPTGVIVGVPDASKGEAIVLLTTQEVTTEQLRAKLLESGLPNLWIPRIIRRVEKIPMLGTGKTDLKACRLLAIELTKDAAE